MTLIYVMAQIYRELEREWIFTKPRKVSLFKVSKAVVWGSGNGRELVLHVLRGFFS